MTNEERRKLLVEQFNKNISFIRQIEQENQRLMQSNQQIVGKMQLLDEFENEVEKEKAEKTAKEADEKAKKAPQRKK